MASNAYYNHGAVPVASPHYLGNYLHPVVPHPAPYNHQLPINHYGPSKALAPAPIVNPYPSLSRHSINPHHVNRHAGYIQHQPTPSYAPPVASVHPYVAPVAGHGHSYAAPAAPTYLPPPVLSPPTITYNNNVIPPSVQNVNHGHHPSPVNYPGIYGHPGQIYGHGRLPGAYPSIYGHGQMYRNLGHYGW